MHALVRLAVLLALLAAELDAARREEGAVRRGVHHLDEPRVEVDLRGQRRDRDERGVAHAQDRRHRLVEEALVAVRRLLEDEHISAGSLRRANLRKIREREEVLVSAGCTTALLYTEMRLPTNSVHHVLRFIFKTCVVFIVHSKDESIK